MESGDLIDLDVTGVAHGGVFVGRHEGRVVLVPDALPGERVRVRLTDVAKKSFWRGEVLEVTDASPHRRPHVWRAADLDVAPEHRPGGADFGHIALDEQRRLKDEVLSDALRRFGGVDLATSVEPAGVGDAVESTDGTGWRTRVSLHVDDDGRIGPYAARSHRVVPTADLPLATPAVAEAAARLSSARPGRVDLVQPADGRVRVLPRTAEPQRRPARPEAVEERVGDRVFRVDAGGFWQVHRLAAATLADRVRVALGDAVDPDAWHLDLYGGVGLFAAVLGEAAGPGARVTTVESEARATEHAGANLAEWIGARAETARVDRWLAHLETRASAAELSRLSAGTVLLDPPRAGAGRGVVEAIARLAPAQVVYVACDPVALARDIGTFRTAGYDVASVTGLDLFPHSHHVEAVATLTRTPARR